MPRAQPEQALQKQIAQFLSVALPPDVWWTTIPLGGGGRVRGAILRGMGTRKGTPDMLLIRQGRATWLELKSPKGRLSQDQAICHAELFLAGARVYVVRSLDDVIAALREAGVPVRVAA